MWSRIRDAEEQFSFENNASTISSYIHPSAAGGGLNIAVQVSGSVLHYSPTPIPNAARRTMNIKWCEGYIDSELPINKIMKFFVGNTISERAVTSALLPKLRPANHNTLRNLSDYIVESVNSVNNIGMYAKLLWASAIRDLYTYSNVQPITIDYAQEAQVSFVNLNDHNLNYELIAEPIARGDIIIVDKHDFDINDLSMVYLLATSGSRLTNPANHLEPHANYVLWPSLKVTILYHQAAPAAPVAAVYNAETPINYAIKLASRRGEMNQLVEALYWVMDHMGIQYKSDPNNAETPARYRLPNFRMADVLVPKPLDYNVLLRLIGIHPSVQKDISGEITQYASITCKERIRLNTLYSACYSCFTSTILHSFQISADRIFEWYMGD
ncbi:hypothetical protein PUN28_006135 [Cardiocondyla obscurior]|uniref:Uncharacterized protein n=1 Tax=Cardiocondyla obscurior TaxID=286306 RepID=A0AAW2GCB8_9HYME